MKKKLKAVSLLLLSIYILVLNPLFSVIAKEPCHNRITIERHNLCTIHLHNSTWTLIANRQLSLPPSTVKCEINVLLFAVIVLASLMLCLQGVKRVASQLNQHFSYPPFPPIYLLNRLLLI
ncbi:hypothetical protein C8P68_1048 [Mucilaginibacter yixingensis]|uniref:Uncharacterized protein n=1 Tax=Mucilaginibacter yixingensis TaxID=1295612 RepID=A0A2T5J936_9SPHI|nr:hypothetical protein [Mucilaginibacter yixingensis]PTQ96524.1 hypothetical protein C8P68_1048 [Mucilaginibacter yixingensis]